MEVEEEYQRNDIESQTFASMEELRFLCKFYVLHY